MMADASTLSELRQLEPMLRADGVSALYLFGSRARGDADGQSDIDLLFDISPGRRFSLFDQARIGRHLSETLHAQVDFIPRRSLHPFIRSRVEAEQVTVFD